jgi:two-component system sensor histidine kinase PrrB
VQLSEQLGDLDQDVRNLRRRVALAGLLVSIAAGMVGWFLGGLASRPLTSLRRDATHLRDDDPRSWKVGERYGSPDVDDVADALNANLRRLADETMRRDRALDAARGFAASASHELRTPLQSALTNLDIARSVRADEPTRTSSVAAAHQQVHRMAASLAAVRALADAEFADPAWFESLDLLDVADAAVADERRRDPDASIEVVARSDARVTAWRQGAQLAIANVVRNALVHGRPTTGTPPHVVVTVDGPVVTVDDDGPGVPEADRARVLQRFVKGAGSGGSGLGLAIAREVAAAHGGVVELSDGPLGGARVTLTFAG